MTETQKRAEGEATKIEREDQSSSSLAGLWLVVHTKPKAEDQAGVELQKQGYRVYLPRLAILRSKQRRAIVRTEPLFPRYLFVFAGTPDAPVQQRPIGYTKGVARIVRFGLKTAHLSDEAIQALQSEERNRMGHPELPISEGSSVIITSGPLAYARGVFEGVDGEGRVRILLELLGQRVPISTDFKTLCVE